MISIGVSVWPALSGSEGGSVPAPPPITAVAADGWQATIADTPPAEYDPVGDPQTVAVTRAGFDATGSAVAVVDTLTLMKRVRQPYPNQNTLTADQVALSDFVYAGDTIGGVTNTSTRAYPQPVAMWLTPTYRSSRRTA